MGLLDVPDPAIVRTGDPPSVSVTVVVVAEVMPIQLPFVSDFVAEPVGACVGGLYVIPPGAAADAVA
jgi:hypothetical protein